jgi:tetratricopeptide (TPR) repeat protein
LGLVTKAINKVEQQEPPLEPQEQSPAPKRKRKLLLVFAALLFIIISLGLGYMFLVKPSQEPPPRLTRRSLSARNRPSVPKVKPAEKAQPDQASAGGVGGEQKSLPAEMAEEKEALSQQKTPSQEIKAPGQRKSPQKPPAEAPQKATLKPAPETKSKKQEGKDHTSDSETGTIPGSDEGSESGESSAQEAQGRQPETETIETAEKTVDIVDKSQELIQEEELSAPPPPSQSEKTDTQPVVSDQTPVTLHEDIPFPQEPPANLKQLMKQWKPSELAVKERSLRRAERYFKKGTTYHRKGKLNQAILSYQEALNFDPDHLSAHTNLATAYLQTGRCKEAEQELVYLYALKPKDVKVIFNFGLLLYRTGELASAETKLEKLLELEPHHLEANLLMASIHEEKGEMGQVLEHCIRAYQVNSADPRVLYRLGRAWDMAGDRAKAISYYRLFLNSHGEKESQWNWAVRDRLDYLVSQKEER